MVGRLQALRVVPRRELVAVVALSAACATLGTESPEGQNLPTSDVGPFRKLGAKEVLGVAPYVLDGLSVAPYAEPSVLALATDPGKKEVALYVDARVSASGATHGAIVRTHADDGVSFYGTSLDDPHRPELVLDASEAWEGGSIHSPGAVRVGPSVYLYYAGSGGIGLAVSGDGVTFHKAAGPVLAVDPSVRWESTPPSEPSVAVFPDGSWHMLYAAGAAIGEATSADGYVWIRASGPVLAPSPAPSPDAIDAGGWPFDTGQVGGPCLLPRLDPAGKTQVRVLYTGYDGPPGAAARTSSIGFAARYGGAGALERSGTPVYKVGKHEAAPALFEWSEGALLYVSQDSSLNPPYAAIAAAVAPVMLLLPHPVGYATSP